MFTDLALKTILAKAWLVEELYGKYKVILFDLVRDHFASKGIQISPGGTVLHLEREIPGQYRIKGYYTKSGIKVPFSIPFERDSAVEQTIRQCYGDLK